MTMERVMKRAVITLLSLCVLAAAQDKPTIAVYVASHEDPNMSKALATRIMNAIVNSGRFQAVERSEEFLKQIAAEQSKQHSGAIDNDQIMKAGREFGVDFVCIAEITPALGSNMVSARVVDVESSEVVAMGDAESQLRTFADLAEASKRIVSVMLKEDIKFERAQKSRPAQPVHEAKPAQPVDEAKPAQPVHEAKPVQPAADTATVQHARGESPVAQGTENFDFRDDAAGMDMVFVQGGTFWMGCTSEQGGGCHADENPAHSVTVGDFYIGRHEVTQKLWKNVMGGNPSYFTGDENLPVEMVSWNDVQEFIRALSAKTGMAYRLPAEAEWEYAARGGAVSKAYTYSGAGNAGDAAWYKDNSDGRPHQVGTRLPNELGIYDMSGNVWEWVGDWYGAYGSGAQKDPKGPRTGSYRVLRGGSWFSDARYSRISYRNTYAPEIRGTNLGFRLAISAAGPSTDAAAAVTTNNDAAPAAGLLRHAIMLPHEIDNDGFPLAFVQGGMFTMGCTAEQGNDCHTNEKPSHSVTLGNFYLGKYEVTQKLWNEVMGNNPSSTTGEDNLPVDNVSWNDAQAFITELNVKTGKKYRLPTEAEWEYAARGGKGGKVYKYSGGSAVGDVAWYESNSEGRPHPVGGKQPNELGIHDMSGNVFEWVSDWSGSYSSGDKTDPQGASAGTYRVGRGGCWGYDARYSRVSSRYGISPDIRDVYMGFRLAIDAAPGTTNAPPPGTKYSLAIGANLPDGGSLSRTPEKTHYEYGDRVTVTAAVAAGYKFAGWLGASTDTASTVTIMMNGNKTLIADFKQLPAAPPPPDTTAAPPPDTTAIDAGQSGGNAGVKWTVAANSPFNGGKVNAIAWGKDKFVAVGDKGKIAYSPDGVNWTAVKKNPFGAVTYISTVAWGNGRFVAGGGYYPPDGDCKVSDSFLRNRGKIAYSSDGITWVEVKNDTLFEYSHIYNIVWGNDKFVAYTSGMACYCESECDNFSNMPYSLDGITWNNGAASGGGFDIAWGNDKFVAAGNSDEDIGSWLYHSSDGITWDYVESPFREGIVSKVAWGGNKFVIVGSVRVFDDEGGDAKYIHKMAYSSDGVTWTDVANYPFKNADTYNVYTIVWANGKFIAASGGREWDSKGNKFKYRNGEMAYSSDGITWTAVKNYPFGNSVTTGIVWGKDRFIAVSADGKIAYSK